jgi:cell wall assembly regulator SMI1
MAYYRITLHRPDQEEKAIVRALAMGLDVTMQRAYVYSARLLAGFPVFHEGETLRQMALGIEGLSADVLEGPPPLVEPEDVAAEALGQAWAKVRAHLARLAPEALESLSPPAYAEDLAVLQRQLGAPLDAELVAWLARHDGCSGRGPLPWKVLSTLEIALTHRQLEADDAGAIGAGSLIVPFASGGAGAFLCVDERGRVVELGRDRRERLERASSLSAWLDDVADGLEQGRLVATAEGGRFHGLLPRAKLSGSQASLTILGEALDERRARVRAALLADPATVANSLFRKLHVGRLIMLRPGAYPPALVLPLLRETLARVEDPSALPGAVVRALSGCEDVLALSATEAQLAQMLEDLYA